MISKFMLFFLIVYMGLYAEEKPKHTTICLNMIVKDESKVIKRCLDSVKPIIDYWVIVDTGSRDGTQKIINDFMKDIPGELYERPWVNFGHNREEALQLAKKKGDYILFIDADEILSCQNDFKLPSFDKDYYFGIVQDNGMSGFRILMIKDQEDWHWKGVLHETLVSSHQKSVELIPKVVTINLRDGHRSEDPKKHYKDAMLLEKALKDDPNNSRYVFYLAQSYECAGMYPEALKNFERRSSMGGFEEEVYWSLYGIGRLQEFLKFPNDVIIKSYYKAFEFNSSRAEPLYQLGRFFNLNKDYILGCIILNVAKKISFPEKFLFSQRWIYDYGVKFELANSYYCMDKFEQSAQIFQGLLEEKEVPLEVKNIVEKNLEKVKSNISGVK